MIFLRSFILPILVTLAVGCQPTLDDMTAPDTEGWITESVPADSEWSAGPRPESVYVVISDMDHDRDMPTSPPLDEPTAEPPCPSNSLAPTQELADSLLALDRANTPEGFIAANFNYGHDGIQLTYRDRQGGTRYTVAVFPTDTIDGWIAVWERPDGTSGDDELVTYSDHLFTGCVNSGTDGNVYLRWEQPYSIDGNTSLEHHRDFQERFNRAMEVLKDRLD